MRNREVAQPGGQSASRRPKLLVSGMVHVEGLAKPVAVRRGMSILAQDGQELGTVAAVVLEPGGQEATHLLLGYVPPTAVYHLIPLKLIAGIDDETVRLQVASQDAGRLRAYQPG
jgi:hypothetical protein